ncbi:MAG: rRNA maturation RNAse YbeY, partial [Patescibacteria group bacterium]|nr:rRNA maturation RNAse YbeY [Patescibacteria group bacterium]
PKQLKAKSQKLILGDIYICPECVETRHGVSLQDVFLHGLIHLVGYDHEKNEREWESILKKLKFPAK